MGERVVLEMTNDIAELENLNQAVTEFCELHGISPKVMFAVNLAVEEIVTNIISYGYTDELVHSIVLSLCLKQETLLITVSDDAAAFNPLAIPPPDLDKPLAERDAGGLGIHFVRKVMDSVEYRRDEGRNVLMLCKKLL